MAVELEPTPSSTSPSANQCHLTVDADDVIMDVHSFSSVTSEASCATGMGDILIPTPPGSEGGERRQTGQCASMDMIHLEELRIKRVQEEQKLAQEAQKRAQEDLKLVQERQKLALVEQELVRLQIEARKADLQILTENPKLEASQSDAVDPQTSSVTTPKEDTETLAPHARSVAEDGSQIFNDLSRDSQHNDDLAASLPSFADTPPPVPQLLEQIARQSIVVPTAIAIERMHAAGTRGIRRSFDRIRTAVGDVHADIGEGGRALEFVAQTIVVKVCAGSEHAYRIAELCKMISDEINPLYPASGIVDAKGNPLYGGALFRKFLLNRCQREFDSLLSSWDSVAACTHGLELTRFIGELYKQGMLTTRIIQECLAQLFHLEELPNPAATQLLATLLRTVVSTMDASGEDPTLTSRYFEEIALIMGMDGLSLRTQDLLQALINDYHNGWL